jgi:hypothetical protein
MPKMKHPAAKRSIEVRDDFVEMYESQGWTVVEPPAKPSK